MTRKEYLAALDQYLVTMSASEKADILSDYEEHFRVGLENGKTESQIAASLGSPYDVANQFLDGEKPKVPTYPARPAASSAAAPTIAAAATTAATTAAASRPAATPSAAAPRPTTSASQPYVTTQRPAAAASQPYATTQRPATSASQSYATVPRPATATSQPYAAAPRPATTAPQPYAAPASQINPYQQNVQAYRPAQTSAQPAVREVYDVGIQNYATAPQNRSSYPDDGGYADYDRQAAERQYETAKPKAESQYNTTGIIVVVVLCVVLIPTVGSTIVSLLLGLYGAVVGFATAGGSLIAVGTALSAASIWVCVGLVFIGISFLALTGLLIMASIEGTKLFVKLIKYCIKECKKMIKEGSF